MANNKQVEKSIKVIKEEVPAEITRDGKDHKQGDVVKVKAFGVVIETNY